MSFELLEEALGRIKDPGLRQTMQDALLDERLPITDTNERWSRVNWAEALAGCPPDEASVAALTTACEAGWAAASAETLRRVAWHAPLESLKRLILPKARARMNEHAKSDYWSYSTTDFLLRAAVRLPAGEFYELLSPGFAKDEGLQGAMFWWRHSGEAPEIPVRPDGEAAELPVRWDKRWLQDAIRQRLPFVAAALAGPEDKEVGPMLLDCLAGLPADGATPILRALVRISHPEVGAATLATVDRLLLEEELRGGGVERAESVSTYWFVLRPMLDLLAPGDIQGLKALISAPPHAKILPRYRQSLDRRLEELEKEASELRRAAAAKPPSA